MKNSYIKFGLLIFFFGTFLSCEDYLEVDVPAHKIVSETVFSEDKTAISAMTGIYNQLFGAAYSGGWENSVTVLSGLSSDNLQSLRENDLSLKEFAAHDIDPNNERNYALWSSAYQIVYMTNSLLAGVENSSSLSEEIRNRLEGEARVVRAFTYFYLVNLYGEVPLILSTNYNQNAQASRNSEEEIFNQVIADLEMARELLNDDYPDEDRTRVNRGVANALLARINLYLKNWDKAEQYSSEVINNSGQYELLQDLNQVFLANSREAIWQITPAGRGGPLGFTNEGSIFIFLSFAPSFTKVSLTDELVKTFDESDLRLQNWIGLNDKTGYYYPFKYKDRSSINEIKEYSMVLRLSEQYLIRSEARLNLNNLEGALQDLNQIKERAGIPIPDYGSLTPNAEELKELILIERRKELFAEWGHRWLDLKRLHIAGDRLSNDNDDWEETDLLYPIPAQERMKNSNLTQNSGY